MKPANFPRKREARRLAANARRIAYEALSLEDKIQRAKPESKQHRRLQRLSGKQL